MDKTQKACLIIWQKNYYHRNKPKFKDYYQANKQDILKKTKSYYYKNKEKILIRTKKYQDNRREAIRAYNNAYYRRKKNSYKEQKEYQPWHKDKLTAKIEKQKVILNF